LRLVRGEGILGLAMKYLAMGERIKSFRERKGLSLQELSKKSKIPKEELQRIEEDKQQPIIGTLITISKALDINVADIFRERPSKKKAFELIKKSDRKAVKSLHKKSKDNIFDYAYELLTTPSEEKHLNAYMIILPPGQKKNLAAKVSHAGEEFLFILEGELYGEIAGEEIHAKAGDSIYLKSSSPHVFYNPTSKKTRAVAVVYPF